MIENYFHNGRTLSRGEAERYRLLAERTAELRAAEELMEVESNSIVEDSWELAIETMNFSPLGTAGTPARISSSAVRTEGFDRTAIAERNIRERSQTGRQSAGDALSARLVSRNDFGRTDDDHRSAKEREKPEFFGDCVENESVDAAMLAAQRINGLF